MRSLAKIIMLWALAVVPAFAADVGFGKITIPNGSEPALGAGVRSSGSMGARRAGLAATSGSAARNDRKRA